MTPDWDRFEQNRLAWRFEGRKARMLRALKLYGLATTTLFAVLIFLLLELKEIFL